LKHYDVVGAVIIEDGFVLCAQRGPHGALGGSWEFPGGKIEPGETPRKALEREIAEELGCSVYVGAEVASTTHQYEFGVVKLRTFRCELLAGTPSATEHAELRWVAPAELGALNWAPADLPAVARIERDATNL
jgi:8-oxo-dGTP diphosphatase